MKKITILYFAKLREAVELDTEKLELPDTITHTQELQQFLCGRGGVWANEFGDKRAVRIAVNQNIAHKKVALKDGDEVAFFPPVTGG